MIEKLILEDIETTGLQMRAEMDVELIEEYFQWLDTHPNDDMVAVSACFDGDSYYMWDGFHRLAAYDKAGRGLIPCQVEKGSRDEALVKALGANERHGRRRSDLDKRHSVEVAIDLFKENVEDISNACCVSTSLVYKILKEKELSGERQKRKKLDIAKEALQSGEYEGLSLEEVAEAIGCSRATVAQAAKELKLGIEGKKPDEEPVVEGFNLPKCRKNVEKSVGAATRAVDDYFNGTGATGSKKHNGVIKAFNYIMETIFGARKSPAPEKAKNTMPKPKTVKKGSAPLKPIKKKEPVPVDDEDDYDL